ncbi:ABC transporter substrate-binding protein [Paenibacillus sp. HWE-109]|uniref:ABC transporter substrate-binding protein n=1 Tax=Paenibacillus sp. HWE-109 TaxID=1306526 RepID=UPI001EDE785D|nr:ABC transporter substrate-binding protein [Paenibacillus sp. HWE-109]UKS23845.1 ABC transporter substrate-binding protein [Paenibacillus sp. HWE-109]
MMKKLTVMIVSSVLVSSFLAGCTSNQETPTKPKSITLNALFMKQAGYSEDAIKEATDAFIKANPNIKVETTFVPYEALEQKILVSNGSYDAVLIDAPWTAKFVKAGVLKEVTDKVPEAARKDIFDGALSAMQYENKLYGMPWLNDVKYLFYNKEMLTQAGISNPPTTWDELIADAKILKEKKIVDFPLVWSWKQAEALSVDYTMMAASFGGQMVKDGKPTLNDKPNIEALNFMYQSMKEGLTNPSSLEYLEEDVRGVFSSGKAAFALNWTYMLGMANDPKESKVVGKVGITTVPGTSKGPGATANGGMGLSIAKDSKYPEETWNYIQFLASKDFQKKHAKDALPIWKSLFSDSEVVATSPELISVSKSQYEHIVNRPVVPWYGQLSTELQTSVQKALTGKETPEDALNKLQEKAKEIASK